MRVNFLSQWVVVILLGQQVSSAAAFTPADKLSNRHRHNYGRSPIDASTSWSGQLPLSTTTTTTTTLSMVNTPMEELPWLWLTVADGGDTSSVDSWRQYLPLVASVAIILDIALGSPAATAAARLLRPDEAAAADQMKSGANTKTPAAANTPDDESKSSSSGVASFFDTLQALGSATPTTTTPAGVNPRELVDSQAIAQEALDKAEASLQLRQFLEDNKSDWQKMQDVQRQLDKDLASFDASQQSKKQQQ